jgi:hypothetical protein
MSPNIPTSIPCVKAKNHGTSKRPRVASSHAARQLSFARPAAAGVFSQKRYYDRNVRNERWGENIPVPRLARKKALANLGHPSTRPGHDIVYNRYDLQPRSRAVDAVVADDCTDGLIFQYLCSVLMTK